MEKNVKSRTEQIQKGMGKALLATDNAINIGREELRRTMRQQKLSCLKEYYKLLTREEERLLSEYDEVFAIISNCQIITQQAIR